MSVCLAMMSLLTAGMANILVNPGLSQLDDFGDVFGWAEFKWNADDSACSAHASGDGSFAVSFRGPKTTYFRQYPIALKPGGRYRLSADVKTSGGGVHLIVWDSRWKRDFRSAVSPADTEGNWVGLSWEGELMDSVKTNAYSVAIAGSGGLTGTNTVQVRNFTLMPLDDGTARESGGLNGDAFLKLPTRIVPIDPLLWKVQAKTGEMTFHWTGVARPGDRLCGRLENGRTTEALLGADGKATLRFGPVAEGEHHLWVCAKDKAGMMRLENDYRFCAIAPVPPGPSGRRLNNFVTELVHVPLANGQVKFYRPTDGWVWIAFDGGADSACGYLDGSSIPTVCRRFGESRLEAMRRVKAGWHSLDVTDAVGGSLRIHAVKTLDMQIASATRTSCDFTGRYGKYSFDFCRRFVFDSINTAAGFGQTRFLGGPQQFPLPENEEVTYCRARGFGILGNVWINLLSPIWTDCVQQEKIIRSSGWRRGFDVDVDESTIREPRLRHIRFADTVWKLFNEHPERKINLLWSDGHNAFEHPKTHVSELAAIANTGYGTGCSIPELYAPATKDIAEVDRWIGMFERALASVGERVPGAADMTLLCFSTYLDLGDWNDQPSPEVDAKAFYSYVLRAYATRPTFDGNNCGMRCGGMACGDEEIRRWIARLFRHYGIEGRTDDLAALRGYSYLPGYVKNCDFADGFSEWTVSPAEEGTLVHKTVKGYGANFQKRKKGPQGIGDCVAQFVTTTGGVNRISQVLRGLEPGKLYSLSFATANADAVGRPTHAELPRAFRARMEGAEELTGLHYLHHAAGDEKMLDGQQAFVYKPVERHVYRAAGTEATLVFEDCNPDGSRLEPRSRQYLNYIIFRPYYTEKAGEEDEIAGFMKR